MQSSEKPQNISLFSLFKRRGFLLEKGCNVLDSKYLFTYLIVGAFLAKLLEKQISLKERSRLSLLKKIKDLHLFDTFHTYEYARTLLECCLL